MPLAASHQPLGYDLQTTELRTSVKLLQTLDQLPECFRRGALSIGNFDGVHSGHARIAERLLAMAKRVGGPAVVFTFEPHPARILRPDQAPTPLCWIERKAQLLGRLGVEAVVAYPIDQAFLQWDAREFFTQIVRERFDARAMVEGYNFLFGHNRTGTIGALRRWCKEAAIEFDVVEPVCVDDITVSSSRVREAIAAGAVDHAWAMLTRPYRIRGTVVRGAGRGAQLGFPTANLDQIDTLLPGEGIYAGRAWVQDEAYPTALNIGPNPTFDERHAKTEAYLIGFEGTLYGRTIEVDFLQRLRDIERFDGVDRLVAQMNLDVAATHRIVEQHDLISEI